MAGQRHLMEPVGRPPTPEGIGAVAPRLELIKSTRGFSRLFAGYESARIVTFVAQASEVLGLFEESGLTRVELVLGESLQQFRSSLDLETLERMIDRLDEGSLKLYLPKKTIHSKLYLLERADGVRVIHGSRNLYPSGSWDSVAVYDLPAGHPQFHDFLRHYEEHRDQCEAYLGDLVGQVRRDPARRRELLEAWLQRESPEEPGAGPAPLLREATQRVLLDPSSDLLTIALPDAPVAQKALEGYLAELRPSVRGTELVVPTQEYLRLVERRVRYPIMAADPRTREVRLILNGRLIDRSAPLPADRTRVGAALEHLERYVATAAEEAPSAWDLEVHQAATAEALLYFLAAPFFHEQMKQRRARVGLVDRRGPLFLVIYGRSSNGKSTFLQFALKLLAGQAVAPLPGREFKESTLERIRSHGTVYPLAFDDVPSVTDRKFEETVKTYWEKRWEESSPVPALIFSTNLPTLRDWARTRVKRVVFPVYFHSRPARKEELHRLLLEENPLFPWFSRLYLDRLAANPPLSGDDLATARQVLLDLYGYAGRPPPVWFPREPFETRFDVGRLDWHDLVYRLRKASVVAEGSRVKVEFTPDLQPTEVAHYESLLPLDLNKDRRGHTLLIYSPDAFHRWLSSSPAPSARAAPAAPAPPLGWAQRLRRRLRGEGTPRESPLPDR